MAFAAAASALAAVKPHLTQLARDVKRVQVHQRFWCRYGLCSGSTSALAAVKPHLTQLARDVKRVQVHQRLSRRAQTEAADTPCLWFRGLLPAEYTIGLLPPPASETTAMVFGAGGASTPGYLIRNHPLYWYTDGSGGKYGHDARLIRAGCGAVGVSCKVHFPHHAAAWRALYGPLPGELQGSDRAEFWALLQLLERSLGDLVGTDCDYLVKCTNAGRLARAASRMATCGLESGSHSIESAKSPFTKSGRTCWLLILVLTWRLTRGQALLAMSWLRLLLRKGPFSTRFRWTWSQPSARPTLLQSVYRSSSTPQLYRPSPS